MHSLVEAAKRSGISAVYEGIDGAVTEVPEETLRRILAALGPDDPASDDGARLQLPPDARCHLPDFLEDKRAWGISLQLYELRSARNCGIGDFADLTEFCRIAASVGADFVGCNPLHALFTADFGRCSPFFPSSRRFLNPLYIAVDQVAEVEWATEEALLADRLRRLDLIDYEAVGRLKMALLRKAWLHWKSGPDGPRDSFAAFQSRGGEALRKHAVFETLSAHLVKNGYEAGWRHWPSAYHDSGSPEVAAFARAHDEDISFHVWLQWLAERQLREAAAAARRSGMRIGLYLDFAVAEAPDGSASWSEPDNFLLGMKIGAPPDMFAVSGQDWGLSPLSPKLTSARRDYYDALIGAAMKHAGALRLDHAMALRRLFLIPEELPASCGAYVRYPMRKSLATIIQKSRQSRTIVIGEDLGNVPEGFRDRLEAAHILSYRVLCFEHAAGEFIPPASYPRLSLACVTTHDLPPLRAWLQASDIGLGHECGVIGNDAAVRQRRERRVLKASLLRALRNEGVVSEIRGHPAGEIGWREWACAIHRFVARTPSLLVAIRLADVMGETMPTNIPGTADSYPNWRQKSRSNLDAITRPGVAAAVAAIMAEERPR